MARYKITRKQIEEMKNFFEREKKVVNEEAKKSAIEHEVDKYLVYKNGFFELAEKLGFEDIKNKNYINRTEELTSLEELNSNTAEESFEFLGIKDSNAIRFKMKNTLIYENEIIYSIVEATLISYDQDGYSDTDYDIIESNENEKPYDKLFKISYKLLDNYLSHNMNDDESDEPEDNESNYVEEMTQLKEVSKRINKGQYNEAKVILEKLNQK